MRLFTRRQPTRILTGLVHILRNNIVSLGLTKLYVLTTWLVRLHYVWHSLARERWLTSTCQEGRDSQETGDSLPSRDERVVTVYHRCDSTKK